MTGDHPNLSFLPFTAQNLELASLVTVYPVYLSFQVIEALVRGFPVKEPAYFELGSCNGQGMLRRLV